MTVNEQNWLERNQRQYLKDILPLDTPLSIQVEPTGKCNFKCAYCYHSLDKSQQRPWGDLPMALYKKFIDSSKKFPHKYKSIIFSGGGEPLLNKNVFKMINMANQVTEESVILTNGLLLNKENCDKLISSQIGVIRISLQGLCADDYYNTCGCKIDFDKFISNLEYLYKNREKTKIVVKMPDIAIKGPQEKKKFYETFGNKCDSLSIQTISSFVDNLDYSNVQKEQSKTLYGTEKKNTMIVCPQIFFTLIILQNGEVAPCADAYYNLNSPIIGDLNKNDIYEIWHSKKLNEIRKIHLNGKRFELKTCNRCHHILPLNNKYDNIDDYRTELLNKY